MKYCTIFFLTLIYSYATAQNVRPIRDDVGFCWDGEQMKRLVAHLEKTEKASTPLSGIVAAIAPHDDYLYSARVGYPLFRDLHASEVVIFGVTHAAVRKEIGDPSGVLLIDDYRNWTGPYGIVRVSPLRDFIKERLDSSIVRIDSRAHALEHSIEALIPFVEHFNPGVKITPIMVTAMSFEQLDSVSARLAEVLGEYVTKNRLVAARDIAFIISNDANHYGPDFDNSPLGLDARAHQVSTENDRRIITSTLTGPVTPEKIRRFTELMNSVRWCGKYSVPFGLLTVQRVVQRLTGRSLDGTLIRYSDTYSEGVLPLTKTGMGITAPFSLKHWVGFFSASYTVR